MRKLWVTVPIAVLAVGLWVSAAGANTIPQLGIDCGHVTLAWENFNGEAIHLFASRAPNNDTDVVLDTTFTPATSAGSKSYPIAHLDGSYTATAQWNGQQKQTHATITGCGKPVTEPSTTTTSRPLPPPDVIVVSTTTTSTTTGVATSSTQVSAPPTQGPGSSGQLPFTGAGEIIALTIIGALAVAGGGVLVWRTRSGSSDGRARA